MKQLTDFSLKKYDRKALLLFASLALLLSLPSHSQTTIGWIEHVSLDKSKAQLKAKIDTGADYSSVNAHDIKRFTKKGVKYVKFTVTDKKGNSYKFTRPYVRTVTIRQRKNCQGPKQRRIVVSMDLCIGGIKKTAQVNLVDRSHFKFHMLIGRSFLKKGNMLVDSNQTMIAKGNCR